MTLQQLKVDPETEFARNEAKKFAFTECDRES